MDAATVALDALVPGCAERLSRALAASSTDRVRQDLLDNLRVVLGGAMGAVAQAVRLHEAEAQLAQMHAMILRGKAREAFERLPLTTLQRMSPGVAGPRAAQVDAVMALLESGRAMGVSRAEQASALVCALMAYSAAKELVATSRRQLTEVLDAVMQDVATAMEEVAPC